MLRRAAAPGYERRLRHKLDKLQLPVLPRVRVSRIQAVLKRLPRLVPPRVIAAVIRTLYKGWTTRRRFQQEGPCCFGCRLGEDSEQHYAGCPRVQAFATRRMRLRPEEEPRNRTTSFLLLDSASLLPDDTLTKRALVTAAAYRAHCKLRRLSPLRSEEEALRALEQAAKDAAAGHRNAMRVLDGRWVQAARIPDDSAPLPPPPRPPQT